MLTNFPGTQFSQHAVRLHLAPASSAGPPQVAASTSGCHNRTFDCTSQLGLQLAWSSGEGSPFLLGATHGNAR